jgi:hypothetical protein
MTNAIPEIITNHVVVVTNFVTCDVTGLDVVNKVNDLYSALFGHFLVMIGIMGGIVGVIIPILLQRFQRQEGRLQEERLNADFKAQMASARNEFDLKFSKLLSEQNEVEARLRDADNKIEKKVAQASGIAAHVDAANHYNAKNFGICIRGAVFASREYIKAEDVKNLDITLGLVIGCLRNLSQQQLKEVEVLGRLSEMEEELKLSEKKATGPLLDTIKRYFTEKGSLG